MKSMSAWLRACFVMGWGVIAALIATAGWTTTWKWLLIPTMSPVFADMRTVQGALISMAQGLNPQVTNPGDPWGRAMNYPSVWIELAQGLGLQNETNYLVFALVSVVGFLFCCDQIVAKSKSIWVLFMVFSGATLLAVERGNNDLVVFVLLFLAAGNPSIFRLVPLVLATALKIYPVLAIPAFVKNKRLLIALVVVCLAVLLFMWQELISIRAGTPVAAGLSYGVASIAAVTAMTPVKVPQSLLTVLIVVCVLIAYGGQFKLFDMTTHSADPQNERWFLLGACIYVGTFLLSSNWDYRLIFLILCMPYLLSIQNGAPRFLMLGCLLVAANQLALYALLGAAGVAINILAKCTLFAFMGSMVLKLLAIEIPLLQRVLLMIPVFPKATPR